MSGWRQCAKWTAIMAAVLAVAAFSSTSGTASPPLSRGEQFFQFSIDECMARAKRAFQADGWGNIQTGARWTYGGKDIHAAYITCNDAGNGHVVVNIFVASDRGDGGVPGLQRERLQALMAGGAPSGGVPPTGGSLWRLTSNCGANWDGTRPNYWTALVTLDIASGGTLKAQFQQDPLHVEFQGAGVNDNTVTMTLHPVGWASVLQLTGTMNGSRIDGSVHHYGSDDCHFTMMRQR